MTDRGVSRHRIAVVRLSIGLVQGGALLLLHWAAEATLWPATENALFEPLLIAALFLPILALAGVGNIRPGTLALWLAAAAALCAGLGWYWIFRHSTLPHQHYVTRFGFYPSLIGILFVTHALVIAADTDRKLIASPMTYFEVSSKLMASVILACLFAGLLGAILSASARLFGLIGIESVGLVFDGWLWILTTTVAVSIVFHLAEDRSVVVRGAVKLLLNLMSWLLLPAVVVGSAFLAALPFTGLEPLWNTKHATLGLLLVTTVLILLIRCHYQDGGADTRRSRVLVHARLIAVLMLAPFVVLASIGLGLRVEQYGWTPTRIVALAWLIVVACHAFGYILVAIRSRDTLVGLASANAVAAFVAVGILVALSSPLADPARLSVADQVARLEAGKIAPDKFDYTMLARSGVRYGVAALQRLRSMRDGADASYVAARADEALRGAYGWVR